MSLKHISSIFRQGLAAKVSELLHRRYAKEIIEAKKWNIMENIWYMAIGLQKEALEYLVLPTYAFIMTVTAFVRANFHAKRGNMTVFGQFFQGLYFSCECFAHTIIMEKCGYHS